MAEISYLRDASCGVNIMDGESNGTVNRSSAMSSEGEGWTNTAL